MGLFGNSKRDLIKSTVLKLSTGLAQIENELKSNNNQVTPMVRGILTALQKESDTLYGLICPNGRTDWDLVNSTTVKEYNGREIDLGVFTSRFYNQAINLYRLTGINIAFSI
jgi:hypothetical protein